MAAATTIYLVSWFIKFIIDHRRFVELANKLPGFKSYTSFRRPWLADIGTFLDTIGTIPGDEHKSEPDLFTWLARYSREYAQEGIFRYWHPFFTRCTVTVVDPHLAAQVLNGERYKFNIDKDKKIYDMGKPVAGDSLIYLKTGPELTAQRKLLVQAIHRDNFIDRQNELLVRLINKHIFPVWDGSSSTGAPIDLKNWVYRLTFELHAQLFCGRSFGSFDDSETESISHSSGRSMYEATSIIGKTVARRYYSHPFRKWLPTWENYELHRCVELFNSTLRQILDERLHEEELSGHEREHKDLITYLTQRDKDGKLLLSYKQILGNCRMGLAGHMPTSSALSSTLWELSGHPEVQKKLQDEIDAVFDEETVVGNGYPPLRKLNKLEYLDAVVKEGLRLHAPGGVAREANEDIVLETKEGTTYMIPKGASIAIHPALTNRYPKSWPDRPDDFVPERFLDGCYRNPNNFIPFSLGVRDCAGRHMGLATMKILIAHTMRRYNLSRVPDYPDSTPLFQVNFTPSHVMVHLEKRQTTTVRDDTDA